MNIRSFARFSAWIGLALIVFVTISPIDARPSNVITTDLDRALAFVAMSGLFVVAYPRCVLAISVVLFFGAFVIELTQFASMTRHPQMHDAVVKALGVIAGVSGGLLANFLLRRLSRGKGTRTV